VTAHLIDIHCHILPSLDDGPAADDEAIAMAELAVREGVETIIATPHYGKADYWIDGSSAQNAVSRFNILLQERNIPLIVLTGQEIRLNDTILDHMETGKLLPLATSAYILIEFPSRFVPKNTASVLHELQVLGYTPIIAHPERNMEIVRKPQIIRELYDHGALFQMTAGSITGHFGKTIQRVSMQLLRAYDIHFIASDAHHPTQRPFNLKAGYETIIKQLGSDYANHLQQNARQILTNQPIAPWGSTLTKRKKWKLRWWKE
jgi:protein-tyrosine phosphatase